MKRVVALLTAFLFLLGCNTYKNSFGETYTSIHTDYTKVYRLDLSHQNLNQIPVEISKCIELRMLDLSGNTDLDLEHTLNQIPAPEVLEILILDSLMIQELPSAIHRFTSLRHLSLNNNPSANFNTICGVLSPMKLEFLSLKSNNLDVLPDNLGSIHSLKSLNLSNNKVGNDRDFIILSALPNLEALWLTNNTITELPTSISGLSSLKSLFIEHNQLVDLPNEFTKLDRLWKLHAGHNRFKELPIELAHMPFLILLHINDNEISSISDDFAGKQVSLSGIIMDNNKLTKEQKLRWSTVFKGSFVNSF